MADFLSDEQVFGTASSNAAADEVAGVQRTPRFLSDDEVFSPSSQASGDNQGTRASPQQPTGDTLPTPARYGVEGAKNVVQGGETLVGQALEGAGVLERGFDKKQLEFMDAIDRGEEPKLTRGQSWFSMDPYGYRDMAPDQRQAFRASMQKTMETPVEQRPLYKAGTAVEKFGQEPGGFLRNYPGWEKGFYHDLTAGAGSMVAGMGLSLIPAVGPFVGGSTFVATGAGQQYQDAKEKGATEDQAIRASQLGTVAGATDLVDALLPSLGAPGKALGLIRRVGLRAVEGAFVEGGQEGVQQFAQNVIAKGIYNPSQDLTDQVGYNMVIGAILGGGASVALGGHGHAADLASDQEVADAYGNPPPPPTQEARLVHPNIRSDVSEAPPVPRPLDNSGAPTQPTLEIPPAAPDIVDQMGRHGIFLDPTELAGTTQPIYPTIPQSPEDFAAQNPDTQQPTATMPPEVAAFLNTQAAPLRAQEQNDFEAQMGPEPPIDENSPQFQDIQSNPGVNAGRLARLLGPKLYGDPTQMTQVTVKEMFQNAFDAVKASLERNKALRGKIDIEMDPRTRQVLIRDNGEGMPTSVMGNEFLQIAGTKKSGSRPSGGLGIAKMLILYGNQNLRVISLRDNKISELNTTGPDLFDSLEDKSKAPTINVRDPTRQDLAMFPSGHGTVVQVTIPQNFTDPSTGEKKLINFDHYDLYHPVLKNSPLFDNIDVTLNGRPVEGMGNRFNYDAYTNFANVNFDWGQARIYSSKGQNSGLGEYTPNIHVLSNGLWQFDSELKKDPNSPYGPNLNTRFFVDVNPKVSPDEAGYPFDLNRQKFSPQVENDFRQIFNYISLVYQQAGIEDSLANFGTLQYLGYSANGPVAGPTQLIKPTAPPPNTALRMIQPGESVKMVDGKLVVNGRQVPELTRDQIEKFKIDPGSLRVPQDQINPRAVMLHDNIEIKLSPLETRAFSDYAREKYGRRFDEFIFHIGNAFRELRDIVVQSMVVPPLEGRDATVPEYKAMIEKDNDYGPLKNEGIGVSLDTQYRGVSIVVPFKGLFVNPFLTVYTDPVRAAVGVVGTMVHEIAHHKVRNHNADFPAEMQKILINLDSNTVGFNFHQFKQKVVNVYNNYGDVFNGLRNVIVGGNFDLQPRGKRFEDPRSESSGIGQSAVDLAANGGGAVGQSGLRRWVAESETVSPSQLNDVRPLAQVASGPTNLDPIQSSADNARAFAADGSPGVLPTPIQPETAVIRDAVKSALGGTPTPPEVRSYAAHADRMNRFYKWFAGLDQLVRSNKRFIPLLKYAERIREMHNDESKIHDAALRVAKEWRRLGQQSENLTAFIDDLANMRYRDDTEVNRGIKRQPTQAEFQQLARKHNLSSDALKVYGKIRGMFDTFLDLVTQNSLDTAQRMIKDPTVLQHKLDQINALRNNLKQVPYFPFTNFGRHFVRVTDAAGHALHFETFERHGLRSAERQQMARYNELVAKYGQANVKYGMLPEAGLTMLGMPSMLLADIKNDPDIHLSDQQKNALDMLVFQRTAQGSFATRFKNKNYVPGYSMDFRRAFARYFFHGARYYSRQKYLWQLKDAISAATNAQGNKANSIADYMRDHLQNTILDYSGDFGVLKGAIFLWALGYVPAAATQNLTQTPMISYPFLAGKFGDIRATREIVKAMSKLSSYYRRGRYDNMTDFEARALSYGIKTGRISETQAPELAGMSQGANLLLGLGGNVAQRGWVQFQEKAAWMFEMAEQFNRRVAYRAALNLALQNPNAKFVQESKNLFADEFQTLVAEYGQQGAAAVVTAANAVDNTQYVYARYARPRVMRGRLPGTLFVFKKYMQSTLFMLAQNKSDVLPRYLLVAAAMGGLGGIPGYDDLKSILQALGAWLFKSHFNLDQEIRKYVLDVTGNKVEPDLVLHGLARRGFGLPGLIDMLGEAPGRGISATPARNVPFPIIDRSRAIGMGNILPVDLGKLATPTNDANQQIAEQAQQASGAVFSVGFNLYKALQDQKNDPTDWKRWEKTLPRALADASRSYRAFTEGRERSRGGVQSASTIVNYDPRDTEQMMEALAIAGGYQPLRLQAKWDTILAKAEVEKFYDMQRDALLSQLFEARFGGNPKELASVQESIRRYNAELPDWAKPRAITAETAMKSMQTRMRTREMRDAGLPLAKTNVTLDRHIESLFPEAKTLDVRKVR